MSVQTEKSFLIDLIQNINDASSIERISDFVFREIGLVPLSKEQLIELDKRIIEHQENPTSGVDAFEFLDSMQSKYEL